MKKILTIGTLALFATACLNYAASAQQFYIDPLADNAVRVRYSNTKTDPLPDWIYVSVNANSSSGPQAETSGNTATITAKDGTTFRATSHSLNDGKATLRFPLEDAPTSRSNAR